MKTKTCLFGFLSLPVVGLLVGVFLGLSSISHDESSRPVVGNVRTFEAAYGRWKTEAERTGQRTKLVLSLGHFKGLSSEFSQAHGKALLDLADGSLSVEVAGLPAQRNFDIWLIHNRPGPGRSVKPETGDRMIRAGALTRQGDNAALVTDLDREALAGFKLDLLVVVPEGRQPTHSGLLYGSPNVFQKLYYAESTTQRLITTRLSDSQNGPRSVSNLLLAPFRSMIPTLAFAAGGGNPHLAELIAAGEKLFFEEKFGGNGRTCGTCHPADNNFTVDPAYIATLPPDDPLFVAESNENLNSETNGGRFFEVPSLMRNSGLILENVDGFEDLANKFVLRGVPHLLGLGLSITPATAIDGTSSQVLQRIGWGGDGAPGTGTLREFAIRAVFQHFTQRLNRVPGVDFRLPTDAELDAIEAFMLSLGPQEELNLSKLKLSDSDASAGLVLFNGPVAKCSLCHFNAGANHALPNPGVKPGTQNANFDTGVENIAGTHPILFPSGLVLPRDGGFGTDSSGGFTNIANQDGSFGNGTFNTPSLVEAANTPPLFHNNSVNTIEQAVGFYNLRDFNDSPAADNPQVGPISLSQTDVDQIGAFLRSINALENIRSAKEKLTNAIIDRDLPVMQKLLQLAIVDINDARRVLVDQVSPLFKPAGLYPVAQARLDDARQFCETAQTTTSNVARHSEIKAALRALELATRDIVD